ncbi:cytosolic protein [Anaerosporomusa subterranea]|uniref:Cytosolic protein n=1 Tax=Anaerosporomusa subterranea TaxID=1794912 RepID=A0A154BNL5_ANASB|nr:metal-sensing transcriptional repressor [Anaerosporomusa subterranea]KYZ75522.1 cytosolic protein [Anaerosporomusa subterranea]
MQNHTHAYRRQVVNRLARIEGHTKAIKQMAVEGRDCPDILLQIAAVRKALDNTAKLILKDHLEHCLIHAVNEGDQEKFLKELQDAIDRYIN